MNGEQNSVRPEFRYNQAYPFCFCFVLLSLIYFCSVETNSVKYPDTGTMYNPETVHKQPRFLSIKGQT